MTATSAALVLLILLSAAVIVLLAVGYLVKRVQALKTELAGLSAELRGPLGRLQSDADVTQAELAALRESLERGAGKP